MALAIDGSSGNARTLQVGFKRLDDHLDLINNLIDCHADLAFWMIEGDKQDRARRPLHQRHGGFRESHQRIEAIDAGREGRLVPMPVNNALNLGERHDQLLIASTEHETARRALSTRDMQEEADAADGIAPEGEMAAQTLERAAQRGDGPTLNRDREANFQHRLAATLANGKPDARLPLLCICFYA